MNNLFKKVYNKILTKKYQNKVDMVSSLTYGDEFYCFIDMDENTKNLNNDQVGSFIYLTCEFPYIYCLYLSHEKQNNLFELNYNLHVDLNKVYKIHIKHFIDYKLKTLSELDIKFISKNIVSENKSVKEAINNQVNIEVGDIITRNEVKYFVSDVTNEGIIAYRIYFNKGTNYIYLINNMYIDKNEPGREFYVSTFAYLNTQEAPLDENKQPIDSSVYPADNVRMMIAPIYACNCHNFFEPCNKEFNDLFNDWNVIANGQIFAWIYNKIFASYFTPYNNFSTFVQNYNILDSMGVQFVYHQGNKETEAGGMQELKAYVEAKLMWDNTLEPEKLAKEFCEHYYKDAGEAYYEYYKLVRFNYGIWEANGLHCYNNGGNSEEVLQKKYWTRDLVDQLDNQFKIMFESIEKYKTSDPALYETLNMRIQKEYLSVRFYYLEYHFDELTYDEAALILNEFEYYCNKHGISVWRELGRAIYTERYITSYIAKKTEQLNKK